MPIRNTLDYDAPQTWPAWLLRSCEPDAWNLATRMLFKAQYVAHKAARRISQAAARSPEVTPQDALNIERIIRAGREQGLSELNIRTKKDILLEVREPNTRVTVITEAEGMTVFAVRYS